MFLILWGKFHKELVGFLSLQQSASDKPTNKEGKSISVLWNWLTVSECKAKVVWPCWPWASAEDICHEVSVWWRKSFTLWYPGSKETKEGNDQVPNISFNSLFQWSNFLEWSQASQRFHQVLTTNKPLTNPLLYESLGALKIQHVIPCLIIHLIIRNKFCVVFNIISSLGS